MDKKELIKKINNKESVWVLCDNKVREFKFDNNKIIIHDDYIEYFYGKWGNTIKLSEIFDEKEDAEFVANNWCKREEKFKPPTWNEFNKKFDKYFGFTGKLFCYCYVFVDENNKLKVHDNDCEYTYYENKFTKENYIEAINIAKSLFMGEWTDEEC